MRYLKLVLVFNLFLFSNLWAQVFIPFSFWRSGEPLVVSPSGTVYIQPADDVTFSATGENGTYTWSITGAAAGDGATITSPGVTSDYTGRTTAYTTDIGPHHA